MSHEASLKNTLLRDPVLRVSAVVYPPFALLQFVPVFDADVQWWVVEYLGSFVLFSLVIWGMLLGLGEETRSRERRFWQLLSVGVGFWLSVHVLYSLRFEAGWTRSLDFTTEILYLSFYLCFVLALELRPHRWIAGEGRDLRERLERFVPVVFVFALLAYLVFVPATLKPERYDSLAPSLLFYVVLDAYLVLRLLFLFADSDSPRWSLVYRWLGIAAGLFLATDVLEYVGYALPAAEIPSGSALDILWLLPTAALTVAARVRVHPSPPVPEYRPDAWGRIRMSSAGSGLIVAYALTVPILAALLSRAGALDPELDGARELVALLVMLALGVMAIVHRRLVSEENSLLERAHRAAQGALIKERVESAKKLERQRAELLLGQARPSGPGTRSSAVQVDPLERQDPSIPRH